MQIGLPVFQFMPIVLVLSLGTTENWYAKFSRIFKDNLIDNKELEEDKSEK